MLSLKILFVEFIHWHKIIFMKRKYFLHKNVKILELNSDIKKFV